MKTWNPPPLFTKIKNELSFRKKIYSFANHARFVLSTFGWTFCRHQQRKWRGWHLFSVIKYTMTKMVGWKLKSWFNQHLFESIDKLWASNGALWRSQELINFDIDLVYLQCGKQLWHWLSWANNESQWQLEFYIQFKLSTLSIEWRSNHTTQRF